jgi:hypothetical protein
MKKNLILLTSESDARVTFTAGTYSKDYLGYQKNFVKVFKD